jgi:rhodanese-related sulfurtransferase
VDISLFQFFQKGNNALFLAVALASGGMLLWPFVRRTTGGPWVTPAQATHLINREDAVVLDVRDTNEFASGHVLGAKNLPPARMETAAGEVVKKKDRPVIVYCDGTDRSGKALAVLKKQGFTRVANLSGGLKAWQAAGLPVEK